MLGGSFFYASALLAYDDFEAWTISFIVSSSHGGALVCSTLIRGKSALPICRRFASCAVYAMFSGRGVRFYSKQSWPPVPCLLRNNRVSNMPMSMNGDIR